MAGEAGGSALSMVSALARLGLDPWEEAGRLASMRRGEAAEQLARLIAEIPDLYPSLPEARTIARALVERLPMSGGARSPPPPGPPRRRREWTMARAGQSKFWLICLVLGAAALVSIIAHGGFPFGSGGP